MRRTPASFINDDTVSTAADDGDDVASLAERARYPPRDEMPICGYQRQAREMSSDAKAERAFRALLRNSVLY
jgi:hypothetical protein